MIKKKIHAKNKGSAFERFCAIWFRDRGWPGCATARYVSKEIDDQKVDLVRTGPFNVQCKAVENLGSSHKVLEEMPTDKINLVFHKKNRQGTVVSMTIEDFDKVLKLSSKKK